MTRRATHMLDSIGTVNPKRASTSSALGLTRLKADVARPCRCRIAGSVLFSFFFFFSFIHFLKYNDSRSRSRSPSLKRQSPKPDGKRRDGILPLTTTGDYILTATEIRGWKTCLSSSLCFDAPCSMFIYLYLSHYIASITPKTSLTLLLTCSII